jgi:hypothetical protein
MNLSKLQSEAVLEFDELWVILTNRKLVSEKPHTKADIKQFLSDQIQKAVEETLKEVENNLCMAECIEPHETENEAQWFYHISEYTWLKLKAKLSIQSKGKMK